jgi:hypothetical protein
MKSRKGCFVISVSDPSGFTRYRCPLRLARSVAIFSTTDSLGLLENISSHSAVFIEGGLAQRETKPLPSV